MTHSTISKFSGCFVAIFLFAIISAQPSPAQITGTQDSANQFGATTGLPAFPGLTLRPPASGEAAAPTPQTTSQAGSPPGAGGRFRSQERNAPVRENKTAIGLGKYFNGIVGGFPHGAGFAFGVQATTADSVPGVEFRATAILTTKLYRKFEIEAYVPSIGDEQTHADLWFAYTRRTKDNFFGIGPRISRALETNFDNEERSYNASLYRDFTNNLEAGIYAQVANASTYEGDDDADPSIDLLFSGDPNVVPLSRWLPGLRTNTKIFSYGAFAEYDRRNNDSGLTRGAYLYGRFGSADGLDVDNVFSDYGWTEAEIDARGYIPLGGDKTSFAMRGYSQLKNPKGGSQVPFYRMVWLGGRNYVRGYDSYRLRGNNFLMFSGELRRTVYTRSETSGVDVVAFGDTGQVWGDNRSDTDPAIIANKEFSSSNWKAGFGGGVQYRHSKSFAVRIDIGSSYEKTRYYFSLSRGF